MNPLKQLERYGQSAWLDNIQRSLLAGGGLARLIAEDGIAGVTSNPSIFEKAIAGSGDYAGRLRELRALALAGAAIYERLAIEDIRMAADILRPVYEQTGRRDGYVSLEVSPHLARDSAATIADARRLWREVDRPNLMIKVPGTPEGLPAVEALVAEGVNVNVTLLFSRAVYRKAADAYLRGLERRAAAGAPVSGVASVASFFVSRIDSKVDALLDARIANAPPGAQAELERLRGKAAIACAKLAYRDYRGLVAEERWKRLAAAGAMPQRLLWASTSTKNPAYRDVVYVEELIGPQTVNTLPTATLEAFRDHGALRASLEEDIAGAVARLRAIEAAGVARERAADELLNEGVRLFAKSFDSLLATVERSRTAA
jgi:transaldolase/glucose-6-phosphate isomerase